MMYITSNSVFIVYVIPAVTMANLGTFIQIRFFAYTNKRTFHLYSHNRNRTKLWTLAENSGTCVKSVMIRKWWGGEQKVPCCWRKGEKWKRIKIKKKREVIKRETQRGGCKKTSRRSIGFQCCKQQKKPVGCLFQLGGPCCRVDVPRCLKPKKRK